MLFLTMRQVLGCSRVESHITFVFGMLSPFTWFLWCQGSWISAIPSCCFTNIRAITAEAALACCMFACAIFSCVIPGSIRHLSAQGIVLVRCLGGGA